MGRDGRIVADEAIDFQQITADLHRELAECKTERDEAIARQVVSTQVLQIINASLGDLGPVFEAILENALHISRLESISLDRVMLIGCCSRVRTSSTTEIKWMRMSIGRAIRCDVAVVDLGGARSVLMA